MIRKRGYKQRPRIARADNTRRRQNMITWVERNLNRDKRIDEFEPITLWAKPFENLRVAVRQCSIAKLIELERIKKTHSPIGGYCSTRHLRPLTLESHKVRSAMKWLMSGYKANAIARLLAVKEATLLRYVSSNGELRYLGVTALYPNDPIERHKSTCAIYRKVNGTWEAISKG